MRIAILTLVLIVSLTATAQARLGETPDQLVARYGQPLSETDQKADGDKVATSEAIFQKGGYQIDVTLVNGVSVAESYKKLNGDVMSVGEVRTLLTANAQEHGWEAPRLVQGEKRWSRDDSATAKLAQDGSLLTIKSRDLIIQQAVAKRLTRQPSLDGF